MTAFVTGWRRDPAPPVYCCVTKAPSGSVEGHLKLTHELRPKWEKAAERTQAGWNLMIDQIAALVE